MRALLPVRRPRTVWLAALGVGACLVENTNAFTSHQHMPVQLRPPHPNNLIVSRPPVHETQWRRVHHEWGKPLRALPVDTDTIRLLSGAAGSGEGAETTPDTLGTLVGSSRPSSRSEDAAAAPPGCSAHHAAAARSRLRSHHIAPNAAVSSRQRNTSR